MSAEEELVKIRKLLEAQLELLDKIFKLFNQYNAQYLEETEQEFTKMD